MSRPLRIEYEHAYYHVMSRGRGRQQIFHDEQYYAAFLKCLEEANTRFGVELHAYCLMGNHYHLLLSTPRGNLGRGMRHINGVYTQRYNRLRKTDGPLFRGRYKAILIDASSYLLPLSRYIHRNPIETRKPLVRNINDYVWSSYPSYVGKATAPAWLTQDVIYGELAATQLKAAYRKYIEQGVDEEIDEFYNKKRQSSIMGDKAFSESAYANAANWDREITRKGIVGPIAAQTIVSQVARHFSCTEQSIYHARRGRGSPNVPRWIAMKLCQDNTGQTLETIGKLFGVNNYCTVSQTVSRLKLLTNKDKTVMSHSLIAMESAARAISRR
ncbi:hypothetical protein MNBD_GAMMA17-1283 [hydrothermal vent metagenome]|uniref:Transposase IS200-like domain-containing protein n=1 Tax=hydrothermal vent metagenome TaxID=652676 RepID=A0A3B0Z637_9ZZZZ